MASYSLIGDPSLCVRSSCVTVYRSTSTLTSTARQAKSAESDRTAVRSALGKWQATACPASISVSGGATSGAEPAAFQQRGAEAASRRGSGLGTSPVSTMLAAPRAPGPASAPPTATSGADAPAPYSASLSARLDDRAGYITPRGRRVRTTARSWAMKVGETESLLRACSGLIVCACTDRRAPTPARRRR